MPVSSQLSERRRGFHPPRTLLQECSSVLSWCLVCEACLRLVAVLLRPVAPGLSSGCRTDTPESDLVVGWHPSVTASDHGPPWDQVCPKRVPCYLRTKQAVTLRRMEKLKVTTDADGTSPAENLVSFVEFVAALPETEACRMFELMRESKIWIELELWVITLP